MDLDLDPYQCYRRPGGVSPTLLLTHTAAPSRSLSPAAEPHRGQDLGPSRGHWMNLGVAAPQQLLKLLPKNPQGRLPRSNSALDESVDLDAEDLSGRWLGVMAQQVQAQDYTTKLFNDLRTGSDEVRLKASYELRDNVVILSRGAPVYRPLRAGHELTMY